MKYYGIKSIMININIIVIIIIFIIIIIARILILNKMQGVPIQVLVERIIKIDYRYKEYDMIK